MIKHMSVVTLIAIFDNIVGVNTKYSLLYSKAIKTNNRVEEI